MEFVRRPSVLAAVAAALLVLNVVVLQDDGSPPDEPVVDSALDDSTDEGEAQDPAEGDDDAAAVDTDGDAAEDAEDAADEAEGEANDGDATSEGDDAADDGSRGAVAAPATGVYTYASSGTWSLTGGPDPVERQLPATATGRVTGGGDAWQIELVAGDQYADRFDFAVGPANGLDWDGWELDRDFGSGPQTTTYTCSGDAAYYVNDAAVGRTSQHGCDTATAASSGTIEYVGTEDVTLGDGTVVTADRLLYTYTVTGTGVSGDGRLDLWLDPATGMRVREQRTIDTVTSANGTEFVYAEDVEFLLQSLTAS